MRGRSSGYNTKIRNKVGGGEEGDRKILSVKAGQVNKGNIANFIIILRRLENKRGLIF